MMWSPTASSVAKKNTKDSLAQALMDIWRLTDEMRSDHDKDEIAKILMRVL